MASIPLKWDSNLRANLVLWPKIAPNIAALANADGQPYVEEDLLKSFPSESSKAPKDARAVRNTFEAMALAGLAYKDSSGMPVLRLSDLGTAVFTFFGVVGGKSFANDRNRRVLADVMIAGLSIVVEYRAIWMLLRRTNGLLSNEELNRAMRRIQYLEDVDRAARLVLESREKGDPATIGPRLYREEEFADEAKRSDQRKAMNPQFLLAGAGRLFIAMEDGTDLRRLEDWAVPIIDRRMDDPSTLVHASTDEETVRLISEHACVMARDWREW